MAPAELLLRGLPRVLHQSQVQVRPVLLHLLAQALQRLVLVHGQGLGLQVGPAELLLCGPPRMLYQSQVRPVLLAQVLQRLQQLALRLGLGVAELVLRC